MQIFYDLAGFRQLPPGLAVSIGNYDGIHRGHRRLIERARELSPAGVALVTFDPHPLTVLRPQYAPPVLTPLALKIDLLSAIGVDYLVVLPPQPQILEMSAEQFWQQLRDDIRPAFVVEGTSFSFGKNRGGNIQTLSEWVKTSSVKLVVVEGVSAALLDTHVTTVSSSLVRWLVAAGRVREAAICLGQPYTLRGTVVTGFQRGRTIGVPTANLDCANQLVPVDGVYAGRCQINSTIFAVAVSIGTSPTFTDGRMQVEAHVIDFTGDLYGKTLDVQLLDWGRDQWKFPSVESLKTRIAEDIAWTKSKANLQPQQSVFTATL